MLLPIDSSLLSCIVQVIHRDKCLCGDHTLAYYLLRWCTHTHTWVSFGIITHPVVCSYNATGRGWALISKVSTRENHAIGSWTYHIWSGHNLKGVLFVMLRSAGNPNASCKPNHALLTSRWDLGAFRWIDSCVKPKCNSWQEYLLE